jgi:hypothetical protein
MTPSTTSLVARDLPRAASSQVTTSAGTGWDEARRPFNLRVDQHPAVVVDAVPADVAATASYASRKCVQVAVQPTGHCAHPGNVLHTSFPYHLRPATGMEAQP